MKVYGLFYNDMIYESADGLVSLHTTEEGAIIALENFRESINLQDKATEQYMVIFGEDEEPRNWWGMRRIVIRELEVKE